MQHTVHTTSWPVAKRTYPTPHTLRRSLQKQKFLHPLHPTSQGRCLTMRHWLAFGLHECRLNILKFNSIAESCPIGNLPYTRVFERALLFSQARFQQFSMHQGNSNAPLFSWTCLQQRSTHQGNFTIVFPGLASQQPLTGPGESRRILPGCATSSQPFTYKRYPNFSVARLNSSVWFMH